MNLRSFGMTVAAAFAVVSSPSVSGITVEQLVEAYSDYDLLQIRRGPTQFKVEATRDGKTVEVIYNAANGVVLWSGVKDSGERYRFGTEFETSLEDFVA